MCRARVASAVREHPEADRSVRANLPTPGKVETAKAGCGHESGNQEGRIAGPPAELKEDFDDRSRPTIRPSHG